MHMKTRAKKGNQTFEKKDVYQIITDLIIQRLENNDIFWKKTWSYIHAQNYITKSTYRGFNRMFLSTLGFKHPFFLTHKQAQDLGGYVRKGEKGFPVIYWSILYFDASGKSCTEEEAEKVVPMLKYFTVFNVSQIENVEFNLPDVQISDFQNIGECERIVKEMPNKPLIDNLGKDRAYYVPFLDRVSMPAKENFVNESAYYSTLFHELTHSTGHNKRLNREGVAECDRTDKIKYSKEELIAEFGASFLCGIAGISNTEIIENSSAYIKHWLEVLKNDNKLLISAATSAQKAVEFICGETVSKEVAA